MNNLKKLLPLLAFILGIGLVFTQSAFKSKDIIETSSTPPGFLYKYKLNTYAEADIKEISNYVRNTTSCPTGVHVCGVYLPTDNGTASQPDPTEFSNVENNLWISESTSTPASAEIEMKN